MKDENTPPQLPQDERSRSELTTSMDQNWLKGVPAWWFEPKLGIVIDAPKPQPESCKDE